MQEKDRVRVVGTAWHGETGTVLEPVSDAGYVTVRLDGRTARYHFPERDLEVMPGNNPQY